MNQKELSKTKVKLIFTTIIGIISFLSSVFGILSFLGIDNSIFKYSEYLEYVFYALLGGSFTFLVVTAFKIFGELKKYKTAYGELRGQEGVLVDNLLHIPLDHDQINEVYVIASSGNSYYGLILSMLENNKIKKNANIHMLVRIGNDDRRYEVMKLIDEKFQFLVGKFGVNLTFYSVDDFKSSFRGIVLDKSIAYLGFYHRRDKITYGSTDKVIAVNSSNDIGKYLIDEFIKSFEGKPKASSISELLSKKEVVND